MAIVQDYYDIPPDITTKLATGEYQRIGSVVRYATGSNKGRIVAHLKPMDLKAAEQVQSLGAKAIQFVQQHKKEVSITAVVASAVGAAILAYNKLKNYEPKVVSEFRASLKSYIEAIREGDMDKRKIDDLLLTIEALKTHKKYSKIQIQLSTDELEVLVGRIHEYTLKLAEDNAVELAEDNLQFNTCTIVNLQMCLMAQKQVFEART